MILKLVSILLLLMLINIFRRQPQKSVILTRQKLTLNVDGYLFDVTVSWYSYL